MVVSEIGHGRPTCEVSPTIAVLVCDPDALCAGGGHVRVERDHWGDHVPMSLDQIFHSVSSLLSFAVCTREIYGAAKRPLLI
jgi:hypothetical protein